MERIDSPLLDGLDLSFCLLYWVGWSVWQKRGFNGAFSSDVTTSTVVILWGYFNAVIDIMEFDGHSTAY